MPRFSIVVPAYNASATLAETLDGMLAQEFEDWECIVVDDGSTDATPAVARAYADRDSRFRLIRQENRGTAGANNAGVRASTADLLVICAADDFLLPQHLRVMDRFVAENPGCEIFSSNGEYLDHESGVRTVVYAAEEWQFARSLGFEDLLQSCFYSVGTVYRRSTYDRVGGFRSRVYVDDYDLWLRAMAGGARHRYTPEVLSVHRASSFQQSANVDRVAEADIEALTYLIENDLVAHEEIPAVKQGVAVREQAIDARQRQEWESRTAERLGGLRHRLGLIVGDRLAGQLIHLGSPLMRALRTRKGLAKHGRADTRV